MFEHEEPDKLDEPDEQKQQQWQARIAQQRLDLSQSVEETLADTSLLQEDDWLDELDSPAGDASAEPTNVKDTNLIPPRLTLQSKPLPIVRPDAPAQPHESSLVQPLSQAPAQPPAVEPIQSKPRLAGRATRVFLKAIRSEEVSQTGQPPPEDTTGSHPATARQTESERAAQLPYQPTTALFGSGVFQREQCDLMISNTHVTSSSVIVVMLTGDPGPVVVQYVSLQPHVGFTVHLSASAKREASFNYVIHTP